MRNQQIIISNLAIGIDKFSNVNWDPLVNNWIRDLTVINNPILLKQAIWDNKLEFLVNGSFFPYRSDIVLAHIIITYQK